jgi:predicted peroxiredoxin
VIGAGATEPIRGATTMAKIMANCTHGKEDPERATLPFIVGNVAVTADQEAVVLLTVEGAWLATKGYADGIQKEGFQPLMEVIQSFVANGGQIWACGACTKPRGITEADLIEGARIVTAANVVEFLASGAAALSF